MFETQLGLWLLHCNFYFSALERWVASLRIHVAVALWKIFPLKISVFLPALTVVDVAGHTLRVEQVAPTCWKENSYYWNQANQKISSDDDPFTYGCILGSCNILRHIGHRTPRRIEACKGTVKTKSDYLCFKCCCFLNVKMFFLQSLLWCLTTCHMK